MPESITMVGTWIGGSGVGIGASSATADVAAGGIAEGATNAALAESAVAGGTAAGYTGSAEATLAATQGAFPAAKIAGGFARSSVIGSLLGTALAPKPPGTTPVTAMPDPLAQSQARAQQIQEAIARRGRASTVLTNPDNALGG